MTVWIVRLKGVYVLELKESSVRIISLLTCGTSTVFPMLGFHTEIKLDGAGIIYAASRYSHLMSLLGGIALLL